MSEQKNLLLAVVFTVAIMGLYQFFYVLPQEKLRHAAIVTQETTLPSAQVPAQAPEKVVFVPREQALTQSQKLRIPIRTPNLNGSINLQGGRIDDLNLVKYQQTTAPDSPNEVLLSPAGTEHAYYTEFGWLSADPSVRIPNSETIWTPSQGVLTPDHPITLIWNNGQGLMFERIITVDSDFMFRITQHVRNSSGSIVNLTPYGLISRQGTPKTLDYFILHEGPLGVFNNTLKEYKYKDLREDGTITQKSTGGWMGITDKYWLVSLVPDQTQAIISRFLFQSDRYQVDYSAPAMNLAPGEEGTNEMRFFAGAKSVNLLDYYEKETNVPKFDLSIDFGWFYFLTKPFFYALQFIAGIVGNFGVAILIFTVFLKLAFFPLANKSFVSMNKMKMLQPQIMELRELYKDDPAKMQQEMMALYKREKANPVSGCLPILIQIPVFFALYKVLFVTIEMRHAPFFGWIHDLSAPDPTTLFNLFGLIHWTPPGILMIGAWPILMGITMFIQQRLNPAPTDPVQAKIFMALPFIFTYMLASFPSGLVIYWAWSNCLSILQQAMIIRKHGRA